MRLLCMLPTCKGIKRFSRRFAEDTCSKTKNCYSFCFGKIINLAAVDGVSFKSLVGLMRDLIIDAADVTLETWT